MYPSNKSRIDFYKERRATIRLSKHPLYTALALTSLMAFAPVTSARADDAVGVGTTAPVTQAASSTGQLFPPSGATANPTTGKMDGSCPSGYVLTWQGTTPSSPNDPAALKCVSVQATTVGPVLNSTPLYAAQVQFKDDWTPGVGSANAYIYWNDAIAAANKIFDADWVAGGGTAPSPSTGYDNSFCKLTSNTATGATGISTVGSNLDCLGSVCLGVYGIPSFMALADGACTGTNCGNDVAGSKAMSVLVSCLYEGTSKPPFLYTGTAAPPPTASNN